MENAYNWNMITTNITLVTCVLFSQYFECNTIKTTINLSTQTGKIRNVYKHLTIVLELNTNWENPECLQTLNQCSGTQYAQYGSLVSESFLTVLETSFTDTLSATVTSITSGAVWSYATDCAHDDSSIYLFMSVQSCLCFCLHQNYINYIKLLEQ